MDEEEATLLIVDVDCILGGQGILGLLGQHKVFLAAEQAVEDRQDLRLGILPPPPAAHCLGFCAL